MTNAVTIRVEYCYRESLHVFSSPQLAGLYVVSDNAEDAYADVTEVIQRLLRENHGIQCQVEPTVPFDEFDPRGQYAREELGLVPHPAILRSQDFVLTRAA
jgi:hypothetical protein